MKKLIITGAAPCVHEDIERVPGYREFDFMAIGLDAVDKYPWPIKYVATYHPEDLQAIRERRASIGNTDYRVISHKPGEMIDIVEPYEKPPGSSALLGALAAIRLGYERIILCGCPLTGKNARNGSYENFRQGWTAKRETVLGKVKSMSGWTREFLGEPTEEWLGIKRPLIVFGSAPCTAEDLARIQNHGRFDHMAVGMDAMAWDGIPDFVATNHPEDIPEIRRRFGNGPRIIGPEAHHGVDIVEPYSPQRERSGSSAITGVLAGIRMGYERIILCGIPLTGNAPEGNPYEAFRLGWEDKKDELVGRVKSMSGWTRNLLGSPPEQWLKGE